MQSDLVFPRTFFAMSADGVIYDTRRGGESYTTIVNDIANGVTPEVVRVFKAHGNSFEDVTRVVVDEVYSAVRKTDLSYIPPFLDRHDPRSADELREWGKTMEQVLAERADNAADRAYDMARERRVA